MKKHFRILFCMIFVLLLALCLFVACNDTDKIEPFDDPIVSIGDCEFTFDKGSESYTLVKCFSTAQDVEVPQNINGYPVTKIGYGAFDSNMATVSVTLPNTVKELDVRAFYNCRSLVRINLENVVRIGDNAFSLCEKLMNITLPDNMECIGKNIISGTALDYSVRSGALYLGNVLYDYKSNQNETSLTIKDGTYYIAKEAVDYSYNLTSVTIPDTVKIIDDYAFYMCDELENIQIPDSVEYVGDGAFSKTPWFGNQPDGLVCIGKNVYRYKGVMEENTDLVIEEGMVSISSNAFATYEVFYLAGSKPSEPEDSCAGLRSITIPSTVKYIGSNLFYGAKSLERITISEGNARYKSDGNCIVDTVNKTVIAGCKAIVIPTDGVNCIGAKAFYGSNITSITIPNNVTSIGESAFANCLELETVTMPSSLSEICDRTFYSCKKLKSITIPNGVYRIGERAFSTCKSLEEVRIPEGVRYIGESAFNSCGNIKNFYFPSSIKEIGFGAFSGIDSIENLYIHNLIKWFDINIDSYGSNPMQYANKIYLDGQPLEVLTIPNTVTEVPAKAFYGAKGIKNIIIPYGVKEIGEYAFDGCEDAVNVVIANSVEKIGNCAFASCKSLVNIDIPKSVKSLDYGIFRDCTSLERVRFLEESLSSIPHSMFSGCTSLKTVVLPSVLTTIGWHAFSDCDSLETIVLPNSVSVIEEYTFSGCDSLKNINIPSILTKIEDGVFEDCSSLESISISNSVIEIGAFAFSNCTSLKNVSIPMSVLTIDETAFRDCSGILSIEADEENPVYTSANNCLIGKLTNTLVLGCKNSVIPDYVTAIGNSAFYGCTDLETIVLPEQIKSINNNAFYGCTKLSSINIPQGVTIINHKAFYGCTALNNISLPQGLITLGDGAFEECTLFTSISMPNNVKYVGESAFRDCTSLERVTMSQGVEEIGRYAFEGTAISTITIPSSVTSIGGGVFARCLDLTEIIVEDGNEGYFVKDGCLIEKSTKTLLAACKNFTLPTDGSVEIIGRAVFKNREDIVSVTLPESILQIDYDAYTGCVNFAELIVHNGVTDIDDMAFTYCESLVVYYDGTMEQWMYVWHVLAEWGYKERIHLIHCTDGDITSRYQSITIG